jgi:hypothetical protein
MPKRSAVAAGAAAARRSVRPKKAAPAAKSSTSKMTSAQRELGGAPSYRSGPAKKGPPGEVLPGTQPLPKRNKKGELVFADHPELRPNLTPAEVMQLGSFGGTYFRPIDSGTTGERETDAYKEFPASWFEGLDIKKQVTRAWKSYDVDVNKYKVKCGGTLDMWESSGCAHPTLSIASLQRCANRSHTVCLILASRASAGISPVDPYGWFQWYCRFYLGRRSTDDERQIARALGVMGPKGRFRNQLIGKCSAASKAFDDPSVSPVIRQSLQHWGYALTQADADAYCKKKSIAPLPCK